MVPELECREAAVYVGVSWSEWVDVMDASDREHAVAHYRAHLLLQAHMDDAAYRKSQRDQARSRARQTAQ